MREVIVSLVFLIMLSGIAVAETYNYTTECITTNITNTTTTSCFIIYNLTCGSNTTCFYNLTVPQINTILNEENLTNKIIKNVTTAITKYCVQEVNSSEYYACQNNFENLKTDYDKITASNNLLNITLGMCKVREIFEPLYYNKTVECEKKINEEKNNGYFIGVIIGAGALFFWFRKKAESPPAGMDMSSTIGV